MLEKNAVKELLYGGLNEILQNRHYYYNSSIGSKYNHFTDAGKVALEEYIKNMSAMMLAAEEISLNKRAKELVIKGLKGEKI
jgi:predicted GIY-YIG superfamily endonuclease